MRSEYRIICTGTLHVLKALHVRERLGVWLAERLEHDCARETGRSEPAVCADDDVRGKHLARAERHVRSFRVWMESTVPKALASMRIDGN